MIHQIGLFVLNSWLSSMDVMFCMSVCLLHAWLLDRSLMIGWMKHSLNPDRMSSVFTFVCVCLCVCPRATVHIFWPRNLFIFYFVFKLWVTVFHLGMCHLDRENLVPLEFEAFSQFKKNQYFTVKGVIFPFFGQFFNITLVADISGMRPVNLGFFQ